ncbi:MAG: hypothetical protein K8R36_11470 [Planctomycetales bacterium]|nr:hypothetical protein [Planctomycetales bacterium]
MLAKVGGGSSGGSAGGIGSTGGGSKSGSSGSGKRLIDSRRDDTADASREGTQKGIDAKKRSSDSNRGKVPIKGDKSLPVAKSIGAPTKPSDGGSDKAMIFPKLNTGGPSGNTPSGGMKKVELPNATSGSGKMLVQPSLSTSQSLKTSPVKSSGKASSKGLPPWIWIAAGVVALIVLAIIAIVVVQNNVGTPSTPKKGGSIHDTSMLERPAQIYLFAATFK